MRTSGTLFVLVALMCLVLDQAEHSAGTCEAEAGTCTYETMHAVDALAMALLPL